MKTFSIAVLGAGGVGKTCLVLRLTKETWDSDYIPTIQDYFEKTMVVGGDTYNLKIIDTAGQDEMQGITDIGIKDAQACVIVYSVTSQVSFNDASKYRDKVMSFASNGQAHIVLAGNKCDIVERSVTRKSGEDLARSWGCEFFETSAKENIKIHELFEAALKTLIPKREEPAPEPAGAAGGKGGKGAEKSDGEGGCCNVA
jgi:small GTP-binding protein